MIASFPSAAGARRAPPGGLPAIPVLDARCAAPAAATARARPDLVADLFRSAARRYTPVGMALGDALSRRWLERNRNPYLADMSSVDDLVGRRGAYLLNCSYEWACTSGVRADPGGAATLARVLDWDLGGLGRNLVVARQAGPAGEWLNVGWPGFAGAVTAVAPGRFAVAINQPPRRDSAAGAVGGWASARAAVWRSRGLPPLCRRRPGWAQAATYAEAVDILSSTPLSTPAFFVVAGLAEGCVIERDTTSSSVRAAAPVAAIANDWVAMSRPGVPRGLDSDGRRRQMEAALAAGHVSPSGGFGWLRPPVLNPDTRVALVARPADGAVAVVGVEDGAAATRVLRLPGQS